MSSPSAYQQEPFVGSGREVKYWAQMVCVLGMMGCGVSCPFPEQFISYLEALGGNFFVTNYLSPFHK